MSTFEPQCSTIGKRVGGFPLGQKSRTARLRLRKGRLPQPTPGQRRIDRRHLRRLPIRPQLFQPGGRSSKTGPSLWVENNPAGRSDEPPHDKRVFYFGRPCFGFRGDFPAIPAANNRSWRARQRQPQSGRLGRPYCRLSAMRRRPCRHHRQPSFLPAGCPWAPASKRRFSQSDLRLQGRDNPWVLMHAGWEAGAPRGSPASGPDGQTPKRGPGERPSFLFNLPRGYDV